MVTLITFPFHKLGPSFQAQSYYTTRFHINHNIYFISSKKWSGQNPTGPTTCYGPEYHRDADLVCVNIIEMKSRPFSSSLLYCIATDNITIAIYQENEDSTTKLAEVSCNNVRINSTALERLQVLDER